MSGCALTLCLVGSASTLARSAAALGKNRLRKGSGVVSTVTRVLACAARHEGSSECFAGKFVGRISNTKKTCTYDANTLRCLLLRKGLESTQACPVKQTSRSLLKSWGAGERCLSASAKWVGPTAGAVQRSIR